MTDHNYYETNGDRKDPDIDVNYIKPTPRAWDDHRDETWVEPAPVDEERQFAIEMSEYLINHDGPTEVDQMQATIERIKEHYGIK